MSSNLETSQDTLSSHKQTAVAMSSINQFVAACEHKNAVEVERMLDEGVDMNARNTGGWPGL